MSTKHVAPSTNADTRPLVRLGAHPLPTGRLRVERSFPGRIENVSLLSTGPALGHGFQVDKTLVEQVVEAGPGLRGRWTHGGLCEDGLGRHLGAWQGLRLEAFRLCRACEREAAPEEGTSCAACKGPSSEEWRAVGDFAFAPSAHKLRPDGLDVAAPTYLMDRAQEDPTSLGVSIVARLAYEQTERGGGDGNDQPSPPPRLARLARKSDLRRADFVADPAANPVGLSASAPAPAHRRREPAELGPVVARALDELVARDGTARTKVRALAFLARYFGDDLDLEDQAHELAAQVERLEGQILALTAETQARRRAEDEALIERLRRESVAAQAPVPEVELERVRTLLQAGERATATTLAEAYLARSVAQGQTLFRREGQTLGPAAPDPSAGSAKALARLFRCRHWDVALTEDGKAIAESTPPSFTSRRSAS